MAFIPLPVPLILLSRWSGGLSDRYGPRPLLIAGPIVTGLGFLGLSLIGITTGPGQYWFTFLPGMLTIGTGLTLTVVPLTNAVMGSVASHFAGTASGINNAVARTAGVLVLAVAGSVAIATFSHQLTERTQPLRLSPRVVASLHTQAARLGGTSVPDGVGLPRRQTVQRAIQDAFLDSFRVIMWGCAALAWLSAAMAAGWIAARPEADP